MAQYKQKFLAAVAVAITMTSMLAFTANAKGRDAGGPKSDITTTLNVLDPLTIGGQTVQPGTYTVKATDSNVTLMKSGKTVAQAPVEWKDEKNKSKSSNLLADSGAVKEIHFSGQTRYVVVE